MLLSSEKSILGMLTISLVKLIHFIQQMTTFTPFRFPIPVTLYFDVFSLSPENGENNLKQSPQRMQCEKKKNKIKNFYTFDISF